MCDEGIADGSAWFVFSGGKGYITSNGKGARVEICGQSGSPGICMYSYPGKIIAKGRGHLALHAGIQPMPGAKLGLHGGCIMGLSMGAILRLSLHAAFCALALLSSAYKP